MLLLNPTPNSTMPKRALSFISVFLLCTALFASPALGQSATKNCSDVNVVVGNDVGDGGLNATLFVKLAKFSELDKLVVPGGLFYEVTGDLTFFVPKNEDLLEEIEYWKDALELNGTESILENKAYVQEILRQYIAYGNVSIGYRGLFVTIDGSIYNWTDTDTKGQSKIELQPVGVQLLEPPVVFYVNDTNALRETCSRSIELSRIVRDRSYARMAVGRGRLRSRRARG